MMLCKGKRRLPSNIPLADARAAPCKGLVKTALPALPLAIM